MTGGPPDKLSSVHRVMAALDAQGRSNIEIGRILGMHPNRVGIVKTSPLYQAALAEERRLFLDAIRESRTEQVDAMFPLALTAKQYALEQREHLPTMNAAADSILDRVYPKAARGAEATVTAVTVRLTVEDARRIETAFVEDGGEEDEAIDVTPPTTETADDPTA